MKIYKLSQGTALTPEEETFLNNIKPKLPQELGDVVTNKRSRDLLYRILESFSQIDMGVLRKILDKVPTTVE